MQAIVEFGPQHGMDGTRTGDSALPVERVADQQHAVMRFPTGACAGVTGMARAIVGYPQ
jgi:hypothetical protein